MKQDLYYHYHTNIIPNAVDYVNTFILDTREWYKDINSKTQIEVDLKTNELKAFYNEVRQMCYWIVEKSSICEYDVTFINAILNSMIKFEDIDLNYIESKLNDKIKRRKWL